MRLDVFLVEKGMVSTRSKAVELISRSLVTVNGKEVSKKNTDIKEGDEVKLLGNLQYVSRGGDKLAGALSLCSLSVKGVSALDIGSSTGGFTDCLLQNGAEKVVAVDVGTGQFDEVLKQDKRVDLHEETDIRYFATEESFDLIVGDVSFISWSNLTDAVARLSHKGTKILLLVKPQFEVGKDDIKKGVVSSETLHERVQAEVKKAFEEAGFTVEKEFESPLKGGDGNTEFFIFGTYEK